MEEYLTIKEEYLTIKEADEEIFDQMQNEAADEGWIVREAYYSQGVLVAFMYRRTEAVIRRQR